LEQELSSARVRRGSQNAEADSNQQPKSLWEELADIGEFIGEELLEFLEKNVGIEPKAATNGAGANGAEEGKGDQESFRDPKDRKQPPPPPPPPFNQDGGAKKSRKEEVDDELEALKRKLGLK
jgi:hypothetical protein